ncbi:MAG: alpha/beta hydrolase [Candidatus Heimdallarchaeota archaeon]
MVKQEKNILSKHKVAFENLFTPYKEMFSWLNSFTLSFIRRESSSSISSSLPMESVFALLDNLAPDKVVRQVRDNAGPFFYKGNKTGILLTHGFSSTAQEMEDLGIFLNKKGGFTTFGTLLAGHGTSPADLALTDMVDWYKSLKKGYDFLSQICDKIILVGHSMGATLSLILAANEEVEGIVTLCAPIKVEYFAQDYLFLISDLLKYFPRKKAEIEIMEENGLLNYRVSALKAVEHLLDLMEIAKEEIPKVTVPIFTITAGHDKRVPLYNAEKIRSLVSSEIKEDYFSPESHHMILFGPEKHDVTNRIYDFIISIL